MTLLAAKWRSPCLHASASTCWRCAGDLFFSFVVVTVPASESIRTIVLSRISKQVAHPRLGRRAAIPVHQCTSPGENLSGGGSAFLALPIGCRAIDRVQFAWDWDRLEEHTSSVGDRGINDSDGINNSDGATQVSSMGPPCFAL